MQSTVSQRGSAERSAPEGQCRVQCPGGVVKSSAQEGQCICTVPNIGSAEHSASNGQCRAQYPRGAEHSPERQHRAQHQIGSAEGQGIAQPNGAVQSTA